MEKNCIDISKHVNNKLEELWRKQLYEHRDDIALCYKDYCWSYSEVDKRSDIVATFINENTDRDYVGVVMDNSDSYVITIIGILKTGKIFVPIDKDYPTSRKDKIVQNCKIDLVICDEDKLVIRCSKVANVKNVLNGDYSQVKWLEGINAYVLHTSGTTGTPKGILVSLSSLVNLINWFGNEFGNSNRIVQLARNSFDVSIEEIFCCLFNGGTLYIPEKEIRNHKKRLREYLKKNNIDLVQVVPVLLKELFDDDERIQCVKIIICGGEALNEQLKESILDKGYILYNNYGPTETTVDALFCKCEKGVPVNLGKSIDNSRICILDEQGKEINDEEIGELCIQGINLAQEYINEPELTADRFVYINGVRTYKTGDLVKRDSHGRIIYIGRLDNQIKLRGQRIELEEIEKAFSNIFDIKICSCILKGILPKQKIVLYYEGPEILNVQLIKDELNKSLPSYMIPTEIVRLSSLPLTVNDKIDKEKLKEYTVEHINNNINVQYDKFTKSIIRMVTSVLEIDQNCIDIDLDLIEIGFDSLSYVEFIIQIEEQYNVELYDEFMVPSTFESLKSFILELEKIIKISSKE